MTTLVRIQLNLSSPILAPTCVLDSGQKFNKHGLEKSWPLGPCECPLHGIFFLLTLIC